MEIFKTWFTYFFPFNKLRRTLFQAKVYPLSTSYLVVSGRLSCYYLRFFFRNQQTFCSFQPRSFTKTKRANTTNPASSKFVHFLRRNVPVLVLRDNSFFLNDHPSYRGRVFPAFTKAIFRATNPQTPSRNKVHTTCKLRRTTFYFVYFSSFSLVRSKRWAVFLLSNTSGTKLYGRLLTKQSVILSFFSSQPCADFAFSWTIFFYLHFLSPLFKVSRSLCSLINLEPLSQSIASGATMRVLLRRLAAVSSVCCVAKSCSSSILLFAFELLHPTRLFSQNLPPLFYQSDFELLRACFKDAIVRCNVDCLALFPL